MNDHSWRDPIAVGCTKEWWPVWPDGCIIFLIFGHLDQGNFAQEFNIFEKVCSQFCQMLNSYSRNDQKLLKFCPSGEILPNLVTLMVTRRILIFKHNLPWKDFVLFLCRLKLGEQHKKFRLKNYDGLQFEFSRQSSAKCSTIVNCDASIILTEKNAYQ